MYKNYQSKTVRREHLVPLPSKAQLFGSYVFIRKSMYNKNTPISVFICLTTLEHTNQGSWGQIIIFDSHVHAALCICLHTCIDWKTFHSFISIQQDYLSFVFIYYLFMLLLYPIVDLKRPILGVQSLTAQHKNMNKNTHLASL